MARYKEGVGRGALFPPACVGSYHIGSPYSATSPGDYSGFDTDKVPSKGFYGVACSANKTGEIEVFLSWNNGPADPNRYYVKDTYSLGVLYFLDDGNKQFIYGTIATDRAKSDGSPVITHVKDWDCELYKS